MMTSSGMFTEAHDPTKGLTESERQIALEQLILVQNKLVSGLDEAQALTSDQRAVLLLSLWSGVKAELVQKEEVAEKVSLISVQEITIRQEKWSDGKTDYLVRAAHHDGMRLDDVDAVARGFSDFMFNKMTSNA